MDESVGIVGEGPAVAAIDAALGDVGVEPATLDTSEASAHAHPIVVGSVGADVFERFEGTDNGWLALELGGIGGRPVAGVQAAISILGGSAGCFQCLKRRVVANLDGESERSTVPPRTARLAGAIAGHQAIAWLEGETRAGTVIEVPRDTRHLYPVPTCECADPIDRSLERGSAAVDLEETVDRAESTVDPRLGLVSAVGEPHSVPAPYYLAELADTTTFSDAVAGPHAAGVSGDWNAAYLKAVGEALERYAAGVYRTENFERAAAETIEHAVPPSAFVLPDENYEPPDPEEPIRWVTGQAIETGERVALPLEFVQHPPPERRHKPSITTGLGLETSGAGALRSGLYEVIERDATMLAWYSTFDPIELSVSADSYARLARRARAEDLSVTALLVTQDVDVPVVAVAVHREEEWPRFAVGSDADLDPAAAAEGALCEALQNWMELRDMGPEGASEESTAIGDYADFPREARTFISTDSTVPAASVGPEDQPSDEEELAMLVDRVRDTGLRPYGVRLTTPDLAAAGFEVVRVLVPEAQPLFTGTRYFGERARTVPRALGYRPRFDRPHHPYP